MTRSLGFSEEVDEMGVKSIDTSSHPYTYERPPVRVAVFLCVCNYGRKLEIVL